MEKQSDLVKPALKNRTENHGAHSNFRQGISDYNDGGKDWHYGGNDEQDFSAEGVVEDDFDGSVAKGNLEGDEDEFGKFHSGL